MLRDLYLAVSQVSVDLKEKTAGRFSFTIASAFDWDAGEFLATRDESGSTCSRCSRSGRRSRSRWATASPAELATPMLTGVVTEISTHFQAGRDARSYRSAASTTSTR